MARELTSNKRKKVTGEYKGKRKLATKRLADVTKEELDAFEKRTGKKGLRAYLNAQKTIKSGERLQQGDTFRQAQKAASNIKGVSTSRQKYATASQKAGTSAAGMKKKTTPNKTSTGGGSDKIMKKKRSLVDRLRDMTARLRDPEKLELKAVVNLA